MEFTEPQNVVASGGDDKATQARLAAIESHLQLIEDLLIGVSRFNARLDQIHAILELAIGVLAPGQHTGSPEMPRSKDRQTGENDGFRIIAYLSRKNCGARLISDVSWSDMWSIRLYITALLRNALQNGLASAECRCWCEVWSPDETGDLIDSARLDPDTGVIEWKSDMDTGK